MLKKCGKADISTFGPLRPSPAQAGILLRRGWFGRLREGFVPNVEMFLDPWKVGGSLTFRQCAKCRNEKGDSPADVLGG